MDYHDMLITEPEVSVDEDLMNAGYLKARGLTVEC